MTCFTLLHAADLHLGWPDSSVGLFFAQQLSRLAKHRMPVALVGGNHDAESELRQATRRSQAELARASDRLDEAALRRDLVPVHPDDVVLKLGALLLNGAIDPHRAGQQDPLLRRAGKLFGGLRGGAFDGPGQFYDENDQPLLKGRRAAGGKPVPVDEMSEGDDIFASFDGERTGRGLDALAAIGEHVQPILFTHDAQVALVAQARLGQAVDVIELRS